MLHRDSGASPPAVHDAQRVVWSVNISFPYRPRVAKTARIR